MTHIFFKSRAFLGLLYLVAGFMPVAALAQGKDVRCGIEYEVIFDLAGPRMGTYSVWDNPWGMRDRVESFHAGLVLPNSEVVLAGVIRADDENPDRIMVAQTRRNGRLRWHKEIELPGVRNVVDILEHDEKSYLLVANVSVKDSAAFDTVWLAFVSKDGALIDKKVLAHKNGDLNAHDIVSMEQGGEKSARYFLAASAPVRKAEAGKKEPVVSVLYSLNSKGRVVEKRSLVMGTENTILGLSGGVAGEQDQAGFFGSGYSYDEHGRKMGWLVRLDQRGALMWHRQYPRGGGAQLVAGQPYLGDAYVGVGTASPLVRNGKRTAWVMAVSRDNGDVLWQRYFTGEPEYFGRDLVVSDDGLVSALIDGDMLPVDEIPAPEEGEDNDEVDPLYGADDLRGVGHVRLMTLNPRGVLFGSGAYYNDNEVNAFKLLQSPGGERIMIGETDAVYRLDELDNVETIPEALKGLEIEKQSNPTGDGEVAVIRSIDGWLAAAIAADEYEDPCAPKPIKAP